MRKVTVQDILSASHVESIPIPSLTTVYTKVFKLSFGEYFSLFWKCTSDGTVSVQIELEQSWVEPATEGASDDNYVIPEGASIIDTETDEVQHCKSISPIPSIWARIKLTGTGSNAASTVIRLRLGQQEEIT